MRSRLFPAIALFVLMPLASGAPEGAAQKVSKLPIVDKAIEFHGGRLYQSSIISLTVSSQSGTFDIVARLQGGQFDYTVTGAVGADKKVQRKVHYTNNSVRRWDDGVEVKLDDTTAQRAKDFVNARVYFPLLPYGLNGNNVFKEDRGIDTWEGKKLHKVKVTFTPGTSTDADDSYMFWFDPATGRMEMFAYDFKTGNGGLRLRKVTAYYKVGGITFSDSDNYAIDGQGFSVDQLTPEYVAGKMKLMSSVKLTNIKVAPIS